MFQKGFDKEANRKANVLMLRKTQLELSLTHMFFIYALDWWEKCERNGTARQNRLLCEKNAKKLFGDPPLTHKSTLSLPYLKAVLHLNVLFVGCKSKNTCIIGSIDQCLKKREPIVSRIVIRRERLQGAHSAFCEGCRLSWKCQIKIPLSVPPCRRFTGF
jgi:hypothetical protein